MPILAANRCRDRAPSVYVADDLSEISGILNPKLGDVAIIVAAGVLSAWRLVESSAEPNGTDVIESNACEYVWVLAGSGSTDINPLWFGIDPTGVNDSTLGIQAWIDASGYFGSLETTRKLGQSLELPKGEYKITDTLYVSNFYKLIFRGDTGATTLIWEGPSDRPMFALINAYQCTFEALRISVRAPYALLSGFDQYNDNTVPGFLYYGRNNRYNGITIQSSAGELGSGWRLGGLSTGLHGVLGDDVLNDFSYWEECSVLNFTLAGWDLEGQNCYDNIMVNCICYGIGATATGVFSISANFDWKRGSMFGQETCFKSGGATTGSYIITGLDVEGSQRLLDTGGASGGSQNWEFNGVRFANTAFWAADGQIVRFSQLGSLLIEKCYLGDIPTVGTANARIVITSARVLWSHVAIKQTVIQNDTSIADIFPQMYANVVQGCTLIKGDIISIIPDRYASPAQQMYGTVQANGGVQLTGLTAALPSYNTTVPAGATTWEYKVTVISEVGESLPTAAISFANEADTLSVPNRHYFVWLSGQRVQGAKAYRIYRTAAGVSPATVGLIAELNSMDFTTGGHLEFYDTGVAIINTSLPPTVNTSGSISPMNVASGFGASALEAISLRNTDGALGSGNRISSYVGTKDEVGRIESTLNGIGVGEMSLFALNTGGVMTRRLQLKATSINIPITGVPVYANNAAALAGLLVAGDLYRTGADPDPVCIVH
jgi:hypothetical protein